MFGSFVKFVVTDSSSETDEIHQSKRRRVEDPIEPTRCLPPYISPEKNKKDKLHNALLQALSDEGLGWIDPLKYGKVVITDVCKLLWLIDGHHNVFSSRSCHIPLFFSKFVGYNRPELSKHRRRSISNMNRDKLLEHAATLQDYATSSWIQQPEWEIFRSSLIKLIESISSYAAYLAVRCRAMTVHHSSSEPAVNFCDASNVRYVAARSDAVSPLLSNLNTAVSNSPMYKKIHVNDYAPKDRRQRYLYVQELERGLSSSIFFFTYSHGSSVGNNHFVWRAPDHVSAEACSVENLRLIEEIKSQIPTFHTRAMKQEFYDLYGRISPQSKPYILRSIYRSLTGDQSTSKTSSEDEIDNRVAEALSMEDPDIIIDLRELNSNKSDRFSVFWDKCSQFLSTCTSVHERRHDSVTFMAKAISVRDLVQEVTKLCPEDTPVPSTAWVQLNFCPKNPHTNAAKHYKFSFGGKTRYSEEAV